ncbi:MAG: hypothetical protein A2Z01_07000 [Betaproteobacteria bacterium RBG_16_58_11]|nr:MAG: hypothetical protein A2Z01_07000 [Betaproteobacteria bacterium RBG_16_58_11]
MKKLNNYLLAAVIALLALPVVGAETAPAKQEAPEALSAPLTKYEISIDRKIVKDPKGLIAKIEAAEGFKAGQCGRVELKKKGVYLYTCAKVTCQTDEAFRGVVQPGVKFLSFTGTCPLGCKLATSCTANGGFSCCRIPVPTQKCPGFVL